MTAISTMARGNQRDQARAKNQKAQASVKSKTNMSGTEFARNKEAVADIMRQKQAAAEAKKQAEAAKK
ncbi:4F5 protein family domain-containing protein [Purpureocillium lavendulum]|uniref:4F5 protein family domain-containing protein n=1 Tax=Purpureocillium lavendulum TaxID=1247861 RepID=A0AB34FPF3_9HYPO|nr:4F5 protein family domain-containing protein [Purpureocillium lavendulum]